MAETDIFEGRAVYAPPAQGVSAVWVETRQAAADRVRVSIGPTDADLTIEGARRLAQHLRALALRAEKRVAALKATSGET